MNVCCAQLSMHYATAQGCVEALRDVTFTVESQEFVAIVGTSGCGKSTLLRLIAGLLAPTAGSVQLTGAADSTQLPTALVFQEHGLFPWMTILENVAFGLKMQGFTRKQCEDDARACIEKMGLVAFTHHFPHQLSGGMKQRVAIARALVARPQILLMDEPFGALDAQTKRVLQEDLLRLWQETQKTVIYVTHDIIEAMTMADRILVMRERPGSINQAIVVPFERPRNTTDLYSEQGMAIQRCIWQQLKKSVHRSLAVEAHV